MALSLVAAVLTTCLVGIAPDGSADANRGAANGTPASEPATPPAAEASSQRVGGDLETQPQRKGDNWVCGDMVVEAPLPEGYPAPTPAGAIEIKHYPSVRRAEFRGSGNSDRGRNGGFWPLFQHIKSRDIAMTSPVEMDYPGWSVNGQGPAAGGAEGRSGPWVMSFLYRSPDLGPTGDDGNVRVVDTEPVTVLAIGMRGPYGEAQVSRGIEQLQAWLADHPEWEVAGDPRAFYYNGPYVANRNKWSEAHLPIRQR
ncbi:MAG: heme-binding protein [Phycisphaerales bacterium]|nr:heme-binding protein [Phycisphaerales bacterium]